MTCGRWVWDGAGVAVGEGVGVVLLILAFAAGCGQQAGEGRPRDSGDVGDSVAEPVQFSATPVAVSRAASPTPVLDTVRVARHEGFDRIVFEFGDEPLPGYGVTLGTGPAVQCGSGHDVPLAGVGRIEIDFDPARAHTEDGKPTIGEIVVPADLAVVRDIVKTCDFEARLVFAIGVTAPATYRVLELGSPARIALDIRAAAR